MGQAQLSPAQPCPALPIFIYSSFCKAYYSGQGEMSAVNYSCPDLNMNALLDQKNLTALLTPFPSTRPHLPPPLPPLQHLHENIRVETRMPSQLHTHHSVNQPFEATHGFRVRWHCDEGEA